MDLKYMRKASKGRKAWTFAMKTPKILIGQLNPRTGKPFGATIRYGLGSRDMREAAAERDIRLGEIRKLVARARRGENSDIVERGLTLRKGILSEDRNPVWIFGVDADGTEHSIKQEISRDMLSGEAHELARQGKRKEADILYGIGDGTAFPFSVALEKYLNSRDDIAISTKNDINTEVERFLEFAREEIGADPLCLQHVDRRVASLYLNEYLREYRSPRAPSGLKKASIERSRTLLSGIWQWAIRSGHIDYQFINPWHNQPITIKSKPKIQLPSEFPEKIYTPDEWNALLNAAPQGESLGDVMRVCIATGCRAGEVAALTQRDVETTGQGFFVREGKTKNASRYVPLFGLAREIISVRASAATPSNSTLFPDLPRNKKTGKSSARISQKFTRLRRRVLGEETNDRLSLHNTRHTWRTIARNATDVPDRVVDELGGWAGQSTTSRPYLHHLNGEEYRQAAWKITV
ncbi:MAG: tyrosine-type recombinase/integrase [Pseudomonadota bacterium]